MCSLKFGSILSHLSLFLHFSFLVNDPESQPESGKRRYISDPFFFKAVNLPELFLHKVN